MSTTERPDRCPSCGAALGPDQDWCLECGAAATTRIVPPPNWRVPIAIIAVLTVLAGAGAAIAFVELADDSQRDVASRSRGIQTVTTPAATTTTQKGGDAEVPGAEEAKQTAIGSWPEGEKAYTVILLSTSNEAGARATAEGLLKIAPDQEIGILRSSEFKSLRPGFWVVFAGRFDGQAEAQKAADAARKAGAPDAYVRLVEPK